MIYSKMLVEFLISVSNAENKNTSVGCKLPTSELLLHVYKGGTPKIYNGHMIYRFSQMCYYCNCIQLYCGYTHTVNSLYYGQPRDGELVSITARVRNNGKLFQPNVCDLFLPGI